MGLVSELRRRNVLRMAVLYLVGAWLIMQVAEVVIGLTNLPNWIGPAIIWLLAIGFPIALVFSWFYEITPEGISLEKMVDRADSITHVTGRRLDFIVISLLCAAIVLFAYDKWWMSDPANNSIAVLPFVNMSDDINNEYFSDGISEELLNLLAQIPELRVAARTSAFSYRGKDVTAAQIGQELNVSHLLEGSVRKAGKEVRITVQLIDARSDSHLWSRTYDRTLNDIFAVQEEIASEVVEQLKVRLLNEVPQRRQTVPEAYALFLQARYAGRQGNNAAFEQAITLFQQALEIDPNFAAAWDGLAAIYVSQAGFGLRPADEGYAEAREAANHALEINPEYAPAHGRLGWVSMMFDRDLAVAARHFERATALAPTDTNIITNAAVLAALLGRTDTAIDLNQYAIARDPLSPGHFNLALVYLWAGRLDDALTSFRKMLILNPGQVLVHYYIGVALLLKGEPDAALRAMHEEVAETWRHVGLAMAYHALGQMNDADVELLKLEETVGQSVAYNVAYVLAFRGEVDRAFEWLEKAQQSDDPNLVEIVGEPLFANLQDDPRWLTFLKGIDRAPEQLAAIDFAVTLPE